MSRSNIGPRRLRDWLAPAVIVGSLFFVSLGQATTTLIAAVTGLFIRSMVYGYGLGHGMLPEGHCGRGGRHLHFSDHEADFLDRSAKLRANRKSKGLMRLYDRLALIGYTYIGGGGKIRTCDQGLMSPLLYH